MLKNTHHKIKKLKLKFSLKNNFWITQKHCHKMIRHEKKFGAHTHFTPHMTLKCCNITTTVKNPRKDQH